MTPDDRPGAASTREAPDDLLLGRLAIEAKLLTPERLREALAEQVRRRAEGVEVPLGRLLLERGWIGLDDLTRLLKEQSRREEGLPSIPRYEIRGRIGQGATAVVYRAWDRELRREVALKAHKDAGGVDDLARQRFRREAQAAGSVAHPNVVTVYDAGEQDGRLYLVMELVDGRSLAELYKEKPAAGDVARLLEKAARGVAAAHARGVIHRDLKPANILLGPDGEPKVGDFGLAHVSGSTVELTRTGATLGTPLYMAPEQVQGRTKDIGPATDVFALGAILYEGLTGRPPFGGEGIMEIYGRITCEEPVPPRRLAPASPEDLGTIALRALEKSPARRYADAGEFADDLRRALDGAAIRARPAGPLVRALRWIRRHKTAAAVGAVALAGLLAVAGVAGAGAASRAKSLAAALDEGRRAREAYGKAEGVEREGLHQKLVGSYRSALHLDPANAEARRALADVYFELFARAEASADRRGMEVYRELALFFDDGRFAPRLEKTGILSVASDPAGAEATLVGAEGVARKLGSCPLKDLRIPAGEYTLLLRAAGFPEAERRLRVDWGEHRELKADLREVSEKRMKSIYEEVRTPYKRGIVVPTEAGTETDVPSVFRHGGRWYLVYTRVKIEEGRHETRLAVSDDLLSWTPQGTLLAAKSEGWDRNVAVGTPALQDPAWGGGYELRTHQGRYWMSFLGSDEIHRRGIGAIGLAWTTDPTGAAPWRRLSENPVLTAVQPGVRPFEARTLVKGTVIVDDAKTLGRPYVMFYEGEDQAKSGREIGLALSDDMIRWERHGAGPVIAHGGGMSGRAQVVRMGDVWVMFYFGGWWRPNVFDTFAASYDLVRWTDWKGPCLIESTEPYDQKYAHKPWVVKHAGVVYHFYCAVGTQGRGIALATSTAK